MIKFIAQNYGSSWDQRLMVKPSSSSTPSQQPSSSTAPATSSQLPSSSSAPSSLNACKATQSKLPSSSSAPSSLNACQATQSQIPSSSTAPSLSSSPSPADSLFYALKAVGIDEDDLKTRFKIANFLRRAKDMQLERMHQISTSAT